MKRLIAALVAAIIATGIPTVALAVPEDSAPSQSSASEHQSSGANEESVSSAPAPENSKTESGEEKKTSAEPSKETSETILDPETIEFVGCDIESIGMHIDLPKDAYIITAGISPDDPTLTAVKLTKQEVEKNFSEHDTVLKAFARDFSYDITITILKNDRTKAIDDLSTLADKELDNIIEELMKNEYAKGNARKYYNNILFLALDMEYAVEDAHIFGKQEYTIVKGSNVIITFQTHENKMTDAQMALTEKIMSTVSVEGVSDIPAIQDAASAKVTQLDIRYILILAASVVAVITLACMIIVGTKYRQSRRLEAENEKPDELYKNSNAQKIEPKTTEPIKPSVEEKPKEPEKSYDTSLFTPTDENVLFKNEELEEERRKREEQRMIPRLDDTVEISIPKNPYTPVGKAETVKQPAMAVTSEFAKLSTISAEAAKNAAENKEKDAVPEDEVVFAESTPKGKTEIEQIGASVFEKQEAKEEPAEEVKDAAAPEEELSEYEKKFGKNRQKTVPEVAATIVPVDEDEKRLSKFEKHFGKVQPAVPLPDPKNDPIAAVDDIIEQQTGVRPEKTDAAEEKPKIVITKAAPQQEISVPDEKPSVVVTKKTPMNDVPEKQISTEIKTDEPEKETAETPVVLKKPEPAEKTEELAAAEASEETITNESDEPMSKDNKYEKRSIFERFKTRLFSSEEEDELPEEQPAAQDTKEGNAFIGSLKKKLQYHPLESDQDIIDSFEQNETEQDGTEIYRAPEPSDVPPQIELSLKKDEAGNIIVDSVNNERGKPVQIELKDGDAQRKALEEAEKEKKKSESEKAEAEPEKAEPEKVEAEQEKVEPEKVEAEPEKVEPEKVETEPEKAETEKAEAEPEKVEPEKVEAEPEKVEPEKVETEPEKVEIEKVEAEPEKVEIEKIEAEPEKTESENAETEPEEKTTIDDAEDTEKRFGYGHFFEHEKKPEQPEEERFDYDNFFPEDNVNNEEEKKKEEASAESEQKTEEPPVESKFEKLFGKNKTENAAEEPTIAAEPVKTEEKAPEELSAYERKFGAAKAAQTAAAVTAGAVTAGAAAAAVIVETAAEVTSAVTNAEATVPSADKTEPEKKESSAEEEKPVPETKEEVPELAEKKEEQEPVSEPEPPKEPEFIFERDAGIIFETAENGYEAPTAKVTPLTVIPKLESVNASDYNKKAEEMRKAPPAPPQLEPEPEPVTPPAPPQPTVPDVNDPTAFYTGYGQDDTLDPFAPGSGEVLPPAPQETAKPKLKDRLKRTFGKLFSAEDDNE